MRRQRPPRGIGTKGPVISGKIMRTFLKITVKKEFLQDEGGVYKNIETMSESLQAALLPLNNEDLQRLPEGTSTINSQKLYTNGEELGVGQQVRDSLDGKVYTVEVELTHNPIHGLKRYVVTKKGGAARRE